MTMSLRTKRNNLIVQSRGFTLIEVLVSIAILAFIMVLVWSSTGQSLDAKERFERRDAIYHEGRVAIRKITDDLNMAFLIRMPAARSAAAVTGVPAVMEIATRPRPVAFFIGEDNGERDELKFTSLSNLRLFKNAKTSDQTKIEYRMIPDAEDPNKFNLVRTYSPWLDEREDVEGTSYVLAKNVREFNVEYFDQRKNEWVRSWNSTLIDWRDQLPKAVKVVLSFPDPDDDNESIVMVTATMVPLSSGPIEF